MESNPVEVAEYTVSKNLHDSPPFVWCAPHVIKKRSCIIADVTKRFHKRTRNYGIEVPNIWDNCVRLDADNGNTLCKEVVRNEMKNIRVALKIMNGGEAVPPTYQETHCHVILTSRWRISDTMYALLQAVTPLIHHML
jgi:hypothetical protein